MEITKKKLYIKMEGDDLLRTVNYICIYIHTHNPYRD